MSLPRSFAPARVALGAALVATLACGDGGTDPEPLRGIQVIAGGTGTDTVGALRDQSLVVEVRDSAGALQQDMLVRFEVLPSNDPLRPYERAAYVCALTAPVCGMDVQVIVVSTGENGRASVQVKHGSLSGHGRVRVAVPDLGMMDTVTYETRPGAPVSAGLPVRDTTILVGETVTLPTGISRFDRFGNTADQVPATVLSATANLTRSGQVVTGADVGRGRVVFDAGIERDTMFFSVVPAGRIALVNGSAIVVANFAGGARRDYAGMQALWNYGLHPAWEPGGARIFAQSGSYSARLHALTLSSGAIVELPTSASLAGQWFPGVSSGWIYFMGETTSGSYGVWRIRPDGSELGAVPTSADYPDYYRPNVSPDGSRIVVSAVSNGVVGVRVYSFPGMTALSPFVGNATAPRWSPDGEWVAFSSPYLGALRIMRADGAELTTVAPGRGFGEWFDWTADSRFIVASTEGGVALVRVSTGEVVPLAWAAGMWQPAVER